VRGKRGQTYDDWVGSESWKGGQEAEDAFGDLVRVKYPEVRRSTLEEQYRHIDWVCSAGSIDVKALKSKNRGTAKDEDTIWVEFKNNVGAPGWLYGEQDFVAFEGLQDYVIVRTGALRRLAEKLCNTAELVDFAELALYKGYSRRNRDDLISMIKRSDLFTIVHKKLKKRCHISTSTTQENLNF
tara:strand:+ start:3613 stop:4164 length:552 start_codon:yes stop_codon:yes gene_type:complete